MQKTIIKNYCDRCGNQITENMCNAKNGVRVELENIAQAKTENTTVVLLYEKHVNCGVDVVKGDLCPECAKYILLKAHDVIK